jgi:hypothetical protein
VGGFVAEEEKEKKEEKRRRSLCLTAEKIPANPFS